MVEKQTLNNFKADVKDSNGSPMEFLMFSKDDKISVRVFIPGNSTHWEKSFDLEAMTKENKNWSFFLSQRDLYDYLAIAIKEKKYTITKSDVDFTFKFHVLNKDFTCLLKVQEAVVEEKKPVPVVEDNRLQIFQTKVLESQKNYDDRFKAIEVKILNFENFGTKVLEIQKKDDDKFVSIEERLKNLEGFQAKILEIAKSNEAKFNQFNDGIDKLNKFMDSSEVKINGLNENIKKLSDSYDSRVKIIEDKYIAQQEILIKLAPKIINYNFAFIVEAATNNVNVKFSNDNKTIEKMGVGWWGFRCDPPAKMSDDKLVFSIKIDHLQTPESHIILGWTSKTTSYSNGYYNNISSLALYMVNGIFYNRTNCSEYIAKNTKAKVAETYTAILDVKEQKVWYLLNGNLFGERKSVVLKAEEIPLICPFVDLYSPEDRVSIVENPEIK